MELLFAQLDGATHMRNADVVVQNVNPAETRDCLRDGVLNRLALRHIGRHRDGDPFLSLDDICGFGRSLVHEIDTRDLRPLPRKRDGGCLPVAPSGAGDPAPKTIAVLPFRRSTMGFLLASGAPILICAAVGPGDDRP